MTQSTSHNSMSDGNKRLRELMQSRPVLIDEVADARVCNDVAYQLYSLRQRSGLTQKELAEKLDVKQSNISRWEKPGYQGYKVKILSKLARKMGGSLHISLTPPLNNYTYQMKFEKTAHEEYMQVNADGSSQAWTRSTSESVTATFQSQGATL